MKGPPHALPSGYCLHRYRIKSVLGSGGFGITYKAVHETLPIRYAIKEYLPVEGAQRGPDGITVQPNAYGQMPVGPGKPTCYDWGRERFLDEARVLADIDNPHVVRVRDFFQANGTAYIVMDYEDGEPLSAVLAREKTLPEERVRSLLEEVLMALEAVHAKGYLHRDIKPHNLYVRARDGSTMLIDFGAARQALASYTKSITNLVSPGYSPLEQYVTGDGRYYGPWTDLYALGALLYQCITGEKPPEAPSRQMGVHFTPAVEAGAGRYRKELLTVVDRALTMKPEERFENVARMRAALVPMPPPVPTLLPEPEKVKQVRSGSRLPAQHWEKWVGVVFLSLLAVVAGMSVLQADIPRRVIKLVWMGTTTRVQKPVLPSSEAGQWKDVTAKLKHKGRKPGEVFQDSLADGSKGPEMVVIPAGEFQMGSPESEEGHEYGEQQHKVRIEKPFAMGKYEVTVGEFRRFVEATLHRTEAELWGRCESWSDGRAITDARFSWRNPGFKQEDNHPVVCVSWKDATAYAAWLSQQTGQPYRLPTEAEWEYAALAGTQTAYWWGDTIGKGKANCQGCGSLWDNKQTAPVGSFAANPFKLYDTVGNVEEWTCSEYKYYLEGREVSCIDDFGARSDLYLVTRGGSWHYLRLSVRAAERSLAKPDDCEGYVGFRLAMTLSN